VAEDSRLAEKATKPSGPEESFEGAGIDADDMEAKEKSEEDRKQLSPEP